MPAAEAQLAVACSRRSTAKFVASIFAKSTVDVLPELERRCPGVSIQARQILRPHRADSQRHRLVDHIHEPVERPVLGAGSPAPPADVDGRAPGALNGSPGRFPGSPGSIPTTRRQQSASVSGGSIEASADGACAATATTPRRSCSVPAATRPRRAETAAVSDPTGHLLAHRPRARRRAIRLPAHGAEFRKPAYDRQIVAIDERRAIAQRRRAAAAAERKRGKTGTTCRGSRGSIERGLSLLRKTVGRDRRGAASSRPVISACRPRHAPAPVRPLVRRHALALGVVTSSADAIVCSAPRQPARAPARARRAAPSTSQWWPGLGIQGGDGVGIGRRRRDRSIERPDRALRRSFSCL